jgi:3-isopropylmalate/(R)-2-methylmalate dehydratase small subunit
VKPFRTLTALVMPLDRADVDTDAILPKQYLRLITKDGYEAHLFAAWRYCETGDREPAATERSPDPHFALNQPRYQGAKLLLCRQNFGCGSSREQAPWALRDYGFRALIAPSFGAIFYDNCLKNGLLPIVLPEACVDQLFVAVERAIGYQLSVDLPHQSVRTPEGDSLVFAIDAFRKKCLIDGLDDVSFALAHADKIRAFEARRREAASWIFGRPSE